MADPRIKQLKIKTGVLKRVGKEKLSYRRMMARTSMTSRRWGRCCKRR